MGFGFGFRVSELLRVRDLGFWDLAMGFGFRVFRILSRVWGIGFRVWLSFLGLGFWDLA